MPAVDRACEVSIEPVCDSCEVQRLLLSAAPLVVLAVDFVYALYG